MTMSLLRSLLITLTAALSGAAVFSLLSFPLPWMLGPLTAVMVFQAVIGKPLYWHPMMKNAGLIVLGISFGLYFTIETIVMTLPYFPLYIIMTFLLIVVSVCLSYVVTKIIPIDPASSIFGSIPGGLTEMVITSQSFHANQAYVTVFQTIRLVIVLFSVPFFILYLFDGESGSSFLGGPSTGDEASLIHSFWYLLPAVLGFKYATLIPAGIMIIPLLITIMLAISPAVTPAVPEPLFLAAQLAVGTSLGRSIAIHDVFQAGRFSLYYGGIAVILILFSFVSGYILSLMTELNLATAMLSAAPGGVIEMVLTADMVGADPAVVTALQLTRILVILLFVPLGLKWFFVTILRQPEQENVRD